MLEYYRPSSRGRRRGIVFPGLICNGHLSASEIQIFEDGILECWSEWYDLALFREKLESGWVMGYVPEGGRFIVDPLGACTAREGRWYDPKGLEETILNQLRQINPELTELLDFEQLPKNAHGWPLEDDGHYYLQTDKGELMGETVPCFYLQEGHHCLVRLAIFGDGSIHLVQPEHHPEVLNLEDLQGHLEEGSTTTSVPDGGKILLAHMGVFQCTEGNWEYTPEQFITHLEDRINTLGGQASLKAVCTEAYGAYLKDPTVARRDRLREAYEAVPLPQRGYLGDMDTYDIPIRMIVYGDQEIEGWTHFIAAKALGKEPPPLSVPHPRDET